MRLSCNKKKHEKIVVVITLELQMIMTKIKKLSFYINAYIYTLI